MTRSVLVVDDEPDVRLLLRMTLQRAGFEVAEVGSAEAAVARVAEQRPDLMLLDLMLPGMDGLEACEKMGEVDFPVILLTASIDESLPERAKASGCAKVLQKGIPSAELLKEIGASLGLDSAPGGTEDRT